MVKCKGLCRRCYELLRYRERGGKPRRVGKSLCSVSDCNEPVAGHSLCRRHYFRWRKNGTAEPDGMRPRGVHSTCIAEVGRGVLCGLPHYGKGYCHAHWQRLRDGRRVDGPLRRVRRRAETTCGVESCETAVHSRGYCAAHYQLWRLYGDPLVRRRGRRGTCLVAACDAAHWAGGFCRKHYLRWLHHGDPHTLGWPAEWSTCSQDGCDREAISHGLCELHWRRKRKWGDPTAINPNTFRPDQPAQVYLIEHDEMRAVKVGVMNVGSIRLDRHTEQGWRLLHVFDFPNGAAAKEVETRILDLWVGITGFLTAELMPHGGASETIDALAYDPIAVFAVAGQPLTPINARLGPSYGDRTPSPDRPAEAHGAGPDDAGRPAATSRIDALVSTHGRDVT